MSQKKIKRSRRLRRETLDQINAIHEAGHAVAALATGGSVTGIWYCDPEHPTDSARSEFESPNPFAAVLIALAGTAAHCISKELIWSVETAMALGGDVDLSFASEQAEELHGAGAPDSVIDTYLVVAAERVRTEILIPNWALVEKIAGALSKQRYLTGEEVLGMVCEPISQSNAA